MIKGNDITVMLDGEIIAGGRTCSLSTDCEIKEVASPDDSQWREFIPTRTSWSIECGHLLTTLAPLMAQCLVAKTVYVKFMVNGVELNGTAICYHVDVTGEVNKCAKGSFKFQGTGALTDAEGNIYFKTSDGEFFVVKA